MPLYRTNSDRGLWKKYREDQPRHFHKPHYLDMDKGKPQVHTIRISAMQYIYLAPALLISVD
jgi:hypothetical protein